MIDVSVIIPARNEPFLNPTIEDLVRNARGSVEVIAIAKVTASSGRVRRVGSERLRNPLHDKKAQQRDEKPRDEGRHRR